MSEQRIERFVNVYRSSLGDTYDSREGADHAAGLLRLRVAQCVEIRDGEPHPDDVGMMLADAKLRSDAATERAEKAEAESRQLCRDFYARRMDERGRFERETAAKLIGQTRYDWNNDNRVYTIETKTAIDEARQLADHYFGTKEAKGDE